MDNNSSRASAPTVCTGIEGTPRSSEFFEATTKAERLTIILCAVLTIAIIADYITTIFYVCNTYRTTTDVKYTSLQIIGIYPIVALASFVSLCVPRAALVSDLMRSIIIAVCIVQFTSLMTHYYGGKREQLHLLQDSKMALNTPPCGCCCACLPRVDVTERNIRRVKMGVLQGFVLQPPLVLLSLVLWLDGEYSSGSLDANNAYLYLWAMKTISTFIALHCLFVVFTLCRAHLHPLRIENKLFALQSVIFFVNIQGLGVDILVALGIPEQRGILTTTVLANAYEQMLLILEMALLTVVARHAYRQPHELVVDVMAIENETVDELDHKAHGSRREFCDKGHLNSAAVID